jgi:hypothetical protein
LNNLATPTKSEFKQQQPDMVEQRQEVQTSTRRTETYFTATDQLNETELEDNVEEAKPDKEQWTADTNPNYDSAIFNEQTLEQGQHFDKNDSYAIGNDFPNQNAKLSNTQELAKDSEKRTWPQNHFLASYSTNSEETTHSFLKPAQEDLLSKPGVKFFGGLTRNNFISSQEIEHSQDTKNTVVGPQFNWWSFNGSQQALKPEQNSDYSAQNQGSTKSKWQLAPFPAVPELDEQEVETRHDRMDDFSPNGGLVEHNETLLKAVGLKHSEVMKNKTTKDLFY